MTTPLVRQLRAACPSAQIEYLTGRNCAAVLRGHAGLDAVTTFDERILYSRQPLKALSLLPLLRGHDCIFVLDKHWVFGWLAWLARVPRRIGFRRLAVEGWPHTRAVPYGALRHEIDCYLDLLAAAGLAPATDDRRMELPPGAPPALTHALPATYTVVANSGGSNAGEQSQVRRMPTKLFRGLCEALREQGPLVFIGTAGEHADYEAVRAHGDVNLCGQTDLPGSWWVLQGARAVYTTDSGVMHMAAAVNPHVTAVFGPTHPGRKCPPGARWVWGDEDIYDSRYELFGAVPSGNYFRRLTVEDILPGVVRASTPAAWPEAA